MRRTTLLDGTTTASDARRALIRRIIVRARIFPLLLAASIGLTCANLARADSAPTCFPLCFLELYSNADGTVQFIVVVDNVNGLTLVPSILADQTLSVTAGTVSHSFRFPREPAVDEVGRRRFMIGTQGFADLGLVQPDFVVPNGFLFHDAGLPVSMRIGHREYGAANFGGEGIPTNGVDALYMYLDEAFASKAIATNSAGDSYAFVSPARFTGSWFNPEQNGHGFALQVIASQPMQLFASWLTFAPQGGQSWIVGLGPIDGNRAVLHGFQTVGSGGRFPPNFNATNVREEDWGTLTFTFSDCDHGHVDWVSSAPGYGNGGMDLTRLTLPAGLTC